MTKKQKDFIAKASIVRDHEVYRNLYIADSGTLYNGIFGKNGYNNMVIIGETEDGCYELITRHSDHFGFSECRGINMDIMKENGFIRMWCDNLLFKIPMLVGSSCLVYAAPRRIEGEK